MTKRKTNHFPLELDFALCMRLQKGGGAGRLEERKRGRGCPLSALTMPAVQSWLYYQLPSNQTTLSDIIVTQLPS